jgi:hypothetical protein
MRISPIDRAGSQLGDLWRKVFEIMKNKAVIANMLSSTKILYTFTPTYSINFSLLNSIWLKTNFQLDWLWTGTTYRCGQIEWRSVRYTWILTTGAIYDRSYYSGWYKLIWKRNIFVLSDIFLLSILSII